MPTFRHGNSVATLNARQAPSPSSCAMPAFDFDSSSKLSTGEYQFSGITRNLQIRVELNYVGTMFGNLPSFSQFAERLVERSQRTFDQPQTAERSDGEVVTVGWQQRIARPNPSYNAAPESGHQPGSEEPIGEDEHKKPDSCAEEARPEAVDDVQTSSNIRDNRPVHQTAPKALPRVITSAQSRIFTYTESDLYTQQTKSLGTNGSGDQAGENPIVFRPRKVAPLSTETIRHPVRENPSVEQHRRQRSFAPAQQKMFIMGYFGAWNKPYNVDDEQILCELRVQGHRVLHMKPDQGTYDVDTKIGHYRYRLEISNYANIDEVPTDPLSDEQLDSDAMVDEQFKFHLPEKQTTFLEYLINLEAAINFLFDGLYVEYEVDLPPNFQASSPDQCSGRTQLCFSQPIDGVDTARFSFPFELAINYKDQVPTEDPFRWPRLLLRVLAEDQWQRYYVAGYGSIALPTIPIAGQKCHVECWRPVNPYSSLCKLREQFIGQAVDIDKSHSTATKMALLDNSKTYSKIGLFTEASGTIVLSVSCMRQSRHYISQQVEQTLRYGRFINQIGLNSSLYYRITRVLLQFEETKRQLIKLRKQHLSASRIPIVN